MDFAAIFDMDGVIVDSNPTHKIAIQEFCKRHNLQPSDQFLEQRIYGRTNKEWIPELFKGISESDMLRLADEKEAEFRRLFDPVANEVPGFRQFLTSLRKGGIKTVVATSAPGENADYILGELGISTQFDSILDSSHVDKGKPEPEVYLKAAEKAGFLPEKCFVFEDSLAGVEAGNRAGASVVGITTTHSSEELNNCLLTISDFLTLTLSDLTDLMKPGL